MADGAGGAERGRRVDRVGRPAEIGLVTGVAIRRGAGVALAVASLTIQRGVSAGQREIRLVMIEGHFTPIGRIMADVALVRIVIGDVIGIRGALIILLMAGVAERRRAGVLSVGMAKRTGGGHMGAGQRISGLRVVIER